MPDEQEIIDTITAAAGRVPRGYAKIGDDVAAAPAGTRKLVMKVDMLVEHTDVPKGMTYRQAARKAVAMCVSDFASKGVKPDSFMVSLGVAKGVTKERVDQLALGFRDARREWGVHLVGGDTNEAHELIIDCAMIGFARRLVLRSGATPGDVLVVTGPFGYPPAGMKILTSGAKAEAKFAAIARMSVLRPSPSLGVGLAIAPYLTSAMDSSDGLARSLHTLANQSGVGFEVTTLPAGEGVAKFAKENRLKVRELVLEGGEEYVVVGTVGGANLEKAEKAARAAGGQLLEIGKATPRRGEVVLVSRGTKTPIRDEGWTHLR
jgi:thiamine-monophosphate kinase